MEVSLEGQVPVLRGPPLDVFQPGGDLVGVHELVVPQSHVGTHLDLVRKTGPALFLPDGVLRLEIVRRGRGSSNKPSNVGDVEKDAVTLRNALDLATVLGLEAHNSKAHFLGDPEIPLVVGNHPEVAGHGSSGNAKEGILAVIRLHFTMPLQLGHRPSPTRAPPSLPFRDPAVVWRAVLVLDICGMLT